MSLSGTNPLTTEEVRNTTDRIRMPQVSIKPELYHEGNTVRHALNILDLRFLNRAFKEDDGSQQFLDIGCATGDFTRDVLLEMCKPYKRFVGVDISHDMISYARQHSSHPKVEYEVLDICGDMSKFIEKYGRFRRVYSFYTLNSVEDQVKAMRNVADLMTVDGECLVKFVGKTQAWDAWRTLARTQRWSSYAAILEGSIPRSHYAEDQRLYIETVVQQSGLRPHTCEALRSEVKVPVQAFKEMFRALLPVSNDMSHEDKEDLLDDFVEEMVATCGSESKDSINFLTTHYFVHASKCGD
ncbi:juvenile hormone acid O-methyltransferase-like [Ornithodoros turicata]|uniref:juvenile hormone acid O-methyltransferase-like n=1 Tax=Ornithodoros turicata TaxID=34597 RepID=UPI00313900FA